MRSRTLDGWIQRVTVAAMVAMAITLMGVGISLYVKPVHASPSVALTH